MQVKQIIIITFIIFSTILLCIGCENGVSDVHGVEYTEGIFQQKDWENLEVSFDRDCISDKQTAISIGKALLLNFQNQGYFPNYELQTVFYDTEDGIWILSFWESKDNYVGSDFSIAISEKDGQVIKMWVGE